MARGKRDAELYAALVVSCRFCGLLRASVAAHEAARRLDPAIRTSVGYTYWMLGDFEKTILADDGEMRWVTNYALPLLGRSEEAIARLCTIEQSSPTELMRSMATSMRAALEGNRAESLAAVNVFFNSRFRDPEGIFHAARFLGLIEERELALETLTRVVRGGFFCGGALLRDPWFTALQGEPRFQALVQEAEDGRREAVEEYRRAGGERLLGVKEAFP